MTTVSIYDDIIDSRDVIARIEELDDGSVLDTEDQMELVALQSLAEQGSAASSDWPYGATLIRDDYFEKYAQELAEDIGAVPRDYTWPTSCIDWTQAARDLKYDYSSIEVDGITYWIR